MISQGMGRSSLFRAFGLFGLAGFALLAPALALADSPPAQQPVTNNVGITQFNGNNSNNVNGGITGSNLTSVGVQTGDNTNTNQLIAPSRSISGGGSSALVLPRNALNMPNASLGRSAFHMQFGVNNNPGFNSLFKGSGNALGWFMQGGVSIPFGKIPDVLRTPSTADAIRMQEIEGERQVFGSLRPNTNAVSVRPTVQGRVVGLNGYAPTTSASPHLSELSSGSLKYVEADKNLVAPKVLALADGQVFSRPLGKGEPVGSISMGEEYRYVGHTSSGWLKLILPNGREGWTQGRFEYLKNDFTEVDALTLHNPTQSTPRTATRNIGEKPRLSMNREVSNKKPQ